MVHCTPDSTLLHYDTCKHPQLITTDTVPLLACSQEAAPPASVLRRAQLRLRAAAHQHAAVPVTRSVNLLYGWAAATCGASARHATWHATWHAARHAACVTSCACNRQHHVTGWSWSLSTCMLQSTCSLEVLAASHGRDADTPGCNADLICKCSGGQSRPTADPAGRSAKAQHCPGALLLTAARSLIRQVS